MRKCDCKRANGGETFMKLVGLIKSLKKDKFEDKVSIEIEDFELTILIWSDWFVVDKLQIPLYLIAESIEIIG